MNEDEILSTVRQLAVELRELPPGSKVTNCEAYQRLQSQPGKGGPLMQWFNRESVQSRKNIISDILGHFARTAYQQKPEFNQNAANELIKLCDRLQPPAIQEFVADIVPSSSDTVQTTNAAVAHPDDAGDTTHDAGDNKHQRAIELWNAGGLSWASITEQVGEEAATWKSFSQAVKRFAARTDQSLRSGKIGPKRQMKTQE